MNSYSNCGSATWYIVPGITITEFSELSLEFGRAAAATSSQHRGGGAGGARDGPAARRSSGERAASRATTCTRALASLQLDYYYKASTNAAVDIYNLV
eukprot:COSAG02_NODE_3590_length_6517_cov_2.757401_9_plen_98_part_00